MEQILASIILASIILASNDGRLPSVLALAFAFAKRPEGKHDALALAAPKVLAAKRGETLAARILTLVRSQSVICP